MLDPEILPGEWDGMVKSSAGHLAELEALGGLARRQVVDERQYDPILYLIVDVLRLDFFANVAERGQGGEPYVEIIVFRVLTQIRQEIFPLISWYFKAGDCQNETHQFTAYQGNWADKYAQEGHLNLASELNIELNPVVLIF